MKFKNGTLLLDDAETAFLSMVAMKRIDTQYLAAEFIGSLAEMKAEGEKFIRETEAKQIPDISDSLRIEITRQVIENLDNLTSKAHEAVEAAGDSIRWN